MIPKHNQWWFGILIVILSGCGAAAPTSTTHRQGAA